VEPPCGCPIRKAKSRNECARYQYHSRRCKMDLASGLKTLLEKENIGGQPERGRDYL
jgi:hypothetical protein